MKTIGLALGGGGARGVAHIAYLEAMEQLGLRPDVIAGTSSGAIVGALYAGGMRPQEMIGLLDSLFAARKRQLAVWLKARKKGDIIASLVRDYFSKVLPKKRFEELDIRLKIVATAFHSLEEKVFDSGDILPALMCSIAFPSVFLPQSVDGTLYMDGGATNIVPFDTIRDECDVLIAIDVSSVRQNSFVPSIKNSVRATWAATQQALLEKRLADCPVQILERPTFENVTTMEFYKYKSVYLKAKEYIPAFIDKLKKNIQGGDFHG